MTSHRFGLYPSFAYGLGGTTNYWQGGLVELLEDEMGAAWPDALKAELPRYYPGVVRQLYGESALQGWRARERAEIVDGVLPTQLLYPRPPFRAAEATGQGTVRADDDGRLTVDWRVSDAVEGAIRRNLDRLAIYTGSELLLPEGSLRERLWSAAHHSGTCRISPDADTGVVDQDLRVHGTQHVYVCDGSVLPSTGASNTGLTIAALAHRLAESLRGEQSGRKASPIGKCLLISGATGAVGQMMRARLAGLGFDWRDVDLRTGDIWASERVNNGVLLHLANAHQSLLCGEREGLGRLPFRAR